MGYISHVLIGLFLVIIVVSYQTFQAFFAASPYPELDFNKYWGPGEGPSIKENPKIESARIHYSKEVIDDLRTQLSRKKPHLAPLEGINFENGFNSKKLKVIVDYWRDNYLPRWAEREDYLNKFPSYITQIQGLRIHYIHVKAKGNLKGKKVYPLILLHGFPGSVLEFYEMIPKLTTATKDNEYVFDVIVPSLPGYGWSQTSTKKGFGTIHMAIVFKNLMNFLGYEKFFIQGGDWGAVIGQYMATIFPENSIGYHSNMCVAAAPIAIMKELVAVTLPSIFIDTKYHEYYLPAFEKIRFLFQETGYMHLQSTKPDTIGAALTDNPVGLAAYIIEKFSTWTNPAYMHLSDGGLEKKFTLDQILDNLMIYYLTNSITSAARLYSEFFNLESFFHALTRAKTDVPTGCAKFRNDLIHMSDWSLSDKFSNIIQTTYINDGGHFAALELPDILYKDVIDFVKKVVSS